MLHRPELSCCSLHTTPDLCHSGRMVPEQPPSYLLPQAAPADPLTGGSTRSPVGVTSASCSSARPMKLLSGDAPGIACKSNKHVGTDTPALPHPARPAANPSHVLRTKVVPSRARPEGGAWGYTPHFRGSPSQHGGGSADVPGTPFRELLGICHTQS